MKTKDIRIILPRDELQQIAENLKASLPPKTGFLLLTFDFGEGGGMRYVSNAKREDAINVLKEWLLKCGAEEDWMKDIK